MKCLYIPTTSVYLDCKSEMDSSLFVDAFSLTPCEYKPLYMLGSDSPLHLQPLDEDVSRRDLGKVIVLRESMLGS